MKDLDLIALTLIVTILYVGFAWSLFSAQKKQQHLKTKTP
jgi:cbb3-type cytochrome oxidase subunit 3